MVYTPRERWYSAYRLQRIKRKEAFNESCINAPPFYSSSSSLVRALKQAYLYDYTLKQGVFIKLFHKYRSKISRQDQTRFLKQIQKWRPEARRRGKERLNNLVYRVNPILALVPKADGFKGKYIYYGA